MPATPCMFLTPTCALRMPTKKASNSWATRGKSFSADSRLKGIDFISFEIKDKNGAVICKQEAGGDPTCETNMLVGGVSDSETNHQLVAEDVTDGENHGNHAIQCRDALAIPALTTLGLVALAAVLAIFGARGVVR